MLHTPLPDRLADEAGGKLPVAFGILIAMGGSLALWGAIYAACIVRF